MKDNRRPDKFQWTCKRCNPPTIVKGASERDVKLARMMHVALVHSK